MRGNARECEGVRGSARECEGVRGSLGSVGSERELESCERECERERGS